MWRRFAKQDDQLYRPDPSNSFFCAMIAAITLRFLDPFGTGKLVLFQVTYDKVALGSDMHMLPLTDRSTGLACARAVIFLDSGCIWCKLNQTCVRHLALTLELLNRVSMVLGSPN